MEEKKALTGKARNLYGISDFAFSFMANIENYYLMFFLTNVAKFPLGGIATATSLAYAGDAIGQPIYAGLISALKPMRWGKNRSYILLFPPLVVLSFVLCFTKIGPEWFALIICGSMLFFTNLTRTFTWTSNLNMMNVLASTPDDRPILASRRATWTAAAGLIYSYAVIPNITVLERAMPEIMVYTFLAAITSIFYMLMCWVTVWATSGYEATGEAAKAQAQSAAQQITLMDILKSALQNPYLLVILGGALISSCFNAGAISSTTYYYTYIGNPSLFPLQLLLGSIIGVITSYLAGPMGKRIGAKQAVLVGSYSSVILNFIASFVAIPSNIGMIVIICIRGLIAGLSMVNMQVLYSDCVVYAKWKTGKETSAFVMGSQTIPIKIGLMLRGILVPLILGISGFDPNVLAADVTMEMKQGIVMMLFTLPAIGGLINALILHIGFRLTPAKVAEMQQEINEREALAADAA
ncbi:MAG: MFS transporter [Coriobacteriia bacterium]|nr:MFS transporter [Coriobacteriia bacterium]